MITTWMWIYNRIFLTLNKSGGIQTRKCILCIRRFIKDTIPRLLESFSFAGKGFRGSPDVDVSGVGLVLQDLRRSTRVYIGRFMMKLKGI